jgi:hypothetical protein
MSKSSSSSSTVATSNASPLEGLDGIEIHLFTGIANMQKIVKYLANRLQTGESYQQHLIFSHVTEDTLAEIDDKRSRIGKYTRMTHYADTDLLIIKLMPSVAHERLHTDLFMKLLLQAGRMGIQGDEISGVGAGRYKGNSSSKEGDSAMKPLLSRPNNTDWPTIVFEAGLSGSLVRLRTDAAWWLRNSNGDVNIVVIISLQRAQSRIQIEKWELGGGGPQTRSGSNNPAPTKVKEITIDLNNVTGAPLVLEFQKILLRPAIPPETDFIFTAQELSGWAATIWRGLLGEQYDGGED